MCINRRDGGYMVNINNYILEELDKNFDEMEFLKVNSDFLCGIIE